MCAHATNPPSRATTRADACRRSRASRLDASIARYDARARRSVVDAPANGADGEACLVLHGWRSNADVSALHARRLRLLKRFRKASCVNGSEEAPHGGGRDDV